MFPEVRVVGNAVPENYIPIKVSENKYFDARRNKFISFPVTGAFEIRYKGELLFSKKQTNLWPHFDEVLNDFSMAYKGHATEYGKMQISHRYSGDNKTEK